MVADKSGADKPPIRLHGFVRRHGLNLAKVAIGAAMIAYLVHVVQADALLARLEQMTPLFAWLALAAGILQYAGFAVRWGVLARCANGRLPYLQAVIGNFELAFVTQVAPSAVAGDAVRVVRATGAGLTLSQAISSVLLDRLFGLLIMAMIAPLLFVVVKTGQSRELVATLLALTFAALVGGLAALVLAERILKPWAETRWAKLLLSVSQSLRVLTRRPKYAALAVVASFGGYMLTALCYQLVAQSLDIKLSLSDALPAVAAITLATFVPISIGGWGVREGASVVILGLIGISAADALATSVGFGIVQTIVGLIGGAVWLVSGYRRAGEKKPPQAEG